MRKIGVLGGSFNPIHIGHLLLAEWAMDMQSLDEVWLIPTGVSYMKNGVEMVSAMQRYEMTTLAAKQNERLRCLDIEVLRAGNTYSYETFEQLKKEYPLDDFYFIVGADCLFSIEKWKYPERIFNSCHLLAAVRDNAPVEEMQQKKKELEHRYQAKIHLMPFLRMEISSTEIRERISMHKSVRYLVPDVVISYIEKEGLYQHEDSRIEKN